MFAAAQQERRAVATENIADFIPLAGDADRRGELRHGLVLIDPMRDPGGARWTLGRLVTELDRALGAHPADEPSSIRYWL